MTTTLHAVPVAESRPAARALSPQRVHRLWLTALLAGTSVLYLWGLGASGYANDFYAAAVQAGTKSWKAFFFGSLDSGNVITVDKPPASLWPMELSGRIFGFSSWSMLVPQAIMGVLSVWLLYATVRRWFGPSAGLLAGALLALTPVAVLMFRFNNPDAMMTLLVVLAAYLVTRAIDSGSTKWLLLAGLTMGFSFLAKGLQPFTVLPALAIAYFVAAEGRLGRRLLQLLAAGVAVVVGAGWWILAVDLTPASSRPYIGGSGDNTALGLAFGYNGLSRITGGNGPGGGGGGGFSGATGVGRLFNSLNGGQIAWLLPAALIAIVALGVVSARAGRTDRTRAAAIMWGGWLLVTGAVLSFASGIIHTYYTVELAPAIAALVAIGAVVMWRNRAQLAARIALAAGVLITGVWSMSLLHRSSNFHPWLATLLVVTAVLAAGAILIPITVRGIGVAAIVLGLVTVTGGSAAYALDTAATPHTGSTPSAGPTVSGGTGGFGGFGGGPAGGRPPGAAGTGRTGGFPGNGMRPPGSTRGELPSGFTPPTGAGSGSRPGGFGNASVSSALVTLLKNAGTTWSAATIGSQSAAPLELQSDTAVIAIGGFSGSDDAPTLAQFRALVKAGKVHYFIGGASGRGGPGGGGAGSAISAWVAKTYTSTTVGGTTVYDLTKAKTS